MSAPSPRVAAVVTAVVVAAGVAAGKASADTLSLSVSGSTDAGITVTATGSAANVSTLNVDYFPAGTGGCPTPLSGGTSIDPDGTQINNGAPFDVSSAHPVAISPGSYQLCGSLSGADSTGTTVTTTYSGAFTVTAADTLSLAGPADAIEGQSLTVTATGAAYDPEAAVFATYKPAGGGCASTPGADTGTISDSADAVSGQYSTDPVSSQVFDAGSYLVCVWLVDSDDEQVLASASTTLDVGALGASIQMTAPAKVDPGQTFPLNVTATLPAGIQVLAQADILPDHRGTTCTGNPDGEPTDAQQALTQSPLTDTQVPEGAVSTSGGQGQVQAAGRYLICAWLLDGWSTSQTPPTVAGPISQVVTVVKPLVFRGLTSQRDALSITVAQASRALESITASDQLRCTKPALLASGQRWNGGSRVRLTAQNLRNARLGLGAIHVRATPDPGVSFKLTARPIGNLIKGSFTEVGTAAGLTGNRSERFQCTSGTVRFTLHG